MCSLGDTQFQISYEYIVGNESKISDLYFVANESQISDVNIVDTQSQIITASHLRSHETEQLLLKRSSVTPRIQRFPSVQLILVTETSSFSGNSMKHVRKW